jgi:putative redox protein
MDINKTFVESAKAEIGIIPYKTTITSASHTLVADEPESIGGNNTGMSPNSLLLASLGSCTAITLRMYITRKMWIVDYVTVNLQLFRTDNSAIIKIELSFTGDLSAEQRNRLVQIANSCPIHKLLVGNINIETTVV